VSALAGIGAETSRTRAPPAAEASYRYEPVALVDEHRDRREGECPCRGSRAGGGVGRQIEVRTQRQGTSARSEAELQDVDQRSRPKSQPRCKRIEVGFRNHHPATRVVVLVVARSAKVAYVSAVIRQIEQRDLPPSARRGAAGS